MIGGISIRSNDLVNVIPMQSLVSASRARECSFGIAQGALQMRLSVMLSAVVDMGLIVLDALDAGRMPRKKQAFSF
jgi:hypothetical protein